MTAFSQSPFARSLLSTSCLTGLPSGDVATLSAFAFAASAPVSAALAATGWSGGTHTAGSTDPLLIPISATAGLAYMAAFSVSYSGSPAGNVLVEAISSSTSDIENAMSHEVSYAGTTDFTFFGLADTQLRLTPTDDFNGTVVLSSVRQLLIAEGVTSSIPAIRFGYSHRDDELVVILDAKPFGYVEQAADELMEDGGIYRNFELGDQVAQGSITAGNPGVVAKNDHGLLPGDSVHFTAELGATLPTALVLRKEYFVSATGHNNDQFSIELTPGGDLVDFDISPPETDVIKFSKFGQKWTIKGKKFFTISEPILAQSSGGLYINGLIGRNPAPPVNATASAITRGNRSASGDTGPTQYTVSGQVDMFNMDTTFAYSLHGGHNGRFNQPETPVSVSFTSGTPSTFQLVQDDEDAAAFNVGLPVRFAANGGTLPAGIVEDTDYFVRNPSSSSDGTNTTQTAEFAATIDGDVVVLSDAGAGAIQVILPATSNYGLITVEADPDLSPFNICNVKANGAHDAVMDTKCPIVNAAFLQFDDKVWRGIMCHYAEANGQNTVAYINGVVATGYFGLKTSATPFRCEQRTIVVYGSGLFVGDEKIQSPDHAIDRGWLAFGDGEGTVGFRVSSLPVMLDPAQNVTILGVQVQYRVTGDTDWINLDVGRGRGPLPAGALNWKFDMTAVSGQEIDVRCGYFDGAAWVYNAPMTLTLGAGLSAPLSIDLAEGGPNFTGDNWTEDVVNGGFAHAAGSGNPLRADPTIPATAGQEYLATLSAVSITGTGTPNARIRAVGGATVNLNTLTEAGTTIDVLLGSGQSHIEVGPTSPAVIAGLTADIRKVSYNGDVQ